MLSKQLLAQLSNPLTDERDQRYRARLAATFPALGSGSDQHSLILQRYLDNRPEKFFDREAFDVYLGWFQKQVRGRPKQLRTYLLQSNSEINRALLFLREINSESWHDNPLSGGDDYELIRVIDKHLHPAYLRLVEGVLVPLLQPLAYFSRKDRNKGVEGLDVYAITQELTGQKEECLIRPYRHIIRNGIGHGGITFLQREIRYRDKKGNEQTFDVTSVTRIFDDLLDTCNGLAAAIKVFFLASRGQGYIPPRELMIEALQDQTRTPWWTIEGCVEAEIVGRSQLTVYARPDSRDDRKVLWSTMQSGILSESLAPGYDRYFFSLRSPKALPGWAAFDGVRLRSLREAQADDLSQYQGILEDNLFFYWPLRPIPKVLGIIDTLATSIRAAIPVGIRVFNERLGIPSILCRNATLHRNSWGVVVRGDVILEGLDGHEIVRAVRNNCGRIVREAKRKASRENGFSLDNFLPIGYARVAVFRRDYRRRRLSGFGLGADLVCTLQIQRISRIKSPDIMGATIETNGKWRIAWNRAWLDAAGEHIIDRERQE